MIVDGTGVRREIGRYSMMLCLPILLFSIGVMYMTMNQITAILLALVVVFVGVYDAIIGIMGIDGASVSHVVRDISTKHPIIPFLIGIVIGHLFWGK